MLVRVLEKLGEMEAAEIGSSVAEYEDPDVCDFCFENSDDDGLSVEESQ